MFGFSFSELVVLIVVAVVVIGPKDLPKVLRKVGQYAGKARRMAADLRAQSGIDDVLRTEGLSESVQEIRKLARGEIADIGKTVRYDGPEAKAENLAMDARAMRDREYPRDGADAFGALPDTALVYEGTLPRGALATDALYRTGDKDGVIPKDPELEALPETTLTDLPPGPTEALAAEPAAHASEEHAPAALAPAALAPAALAIAVHVPAAHVIPPDAEAAGDAGLAEEEAPAARAGSV